MFPPPHVFVSQDQSPGNHGNAGLDPVTFHCELDPKLTVENLPFFIPDIQGTWGAACGRNRGLFVVDPPDGHTYGEREGFLRRTAVTHKRGRKQVPKTG